MADNGDEIAVAAWLDADGAEAVVGVRAGDVLDQTSEHLAGLRFGGWEGWLRAHRAI